MIHRFLSFIVVTIVVLGVMVFGIGFATYMGKVTRYVQPEIDVNLMATDAVVVLTGGSDRLKLGTEILLAGKGEKMLVTGVHPKVSFETIFDEENVPRDVQECCIILGRTASDTYGNAEEAKAFMDENEFRSMILVTSNYHMPRSLLAFRKLMPKTLIIPFPVQSPSINLTGWWNRTGTLFLLLEEYCKYAAVWISS